MDKLAIKLFNVVDHSDLSEMLVDELPSDGDPLEVDGELYFVCEQEYSRKSDLPAVGVIPLVVRNPAKVENIKKYVECLSIAHRKVQFRNENGSCELGNCNEMIIS